MRVQAWWAGIQPSTMNRLQRFGVDDDESIRGLSAEAIHNPDLGLAARPACRQSARN
jgi:hypothetical protein